MNCRHCNAPLDEGTVICPACGGDNSAPAQNKNRRKTAIIVGIVVVAVLVVAIIVAYFALTGSGSKESYTGTNEQLLNSMDTVVATAGDLKLTNGELQVAYWNMVYDFVSIYSDYISYILDLSIPLDQQYYDSEEGITWQEYFLDLALNNWWTNAILAADAEAAGVEMSADLKAYLDTLYDDLSVNLNQYGFYSVEEMLAHDFGIGCTYDDYKKNTAAYYYANEYYNYLFENMAVTDAEIEAYFAEHEADFVSAGYGKDTGNVVDVRHILLSPNDEKDATKDTFTDEEWADCKVRAEAMLAQWEANATEEYFISLATEHSTCPSAAQGGLIEDIQAGQMVTEFNNWIMAEGRQYGDYGMVKTMYGYHIIFFVDNSPLWYEAAKYNLVADNLAEQMSQREEQLPLVVDYSKIWLSDVSLLG